MKLINDKFQNWRNYGIKYHSIDFILSDIPYNLGNNAYASSTQWYERGDIKNGESEYANAQFFDADIGFDVDEYLQACTDLLTMPREGKNVDGCVITFCSFDQLIEIKQKAPHYGFKGYDQLFFIKKSSPQALKANMRYCGATEYACLLYRNKLPMFNNDGNMKLNWFNFSLEVRKKEHETQKPLHLMQELIKLHTDKGQTVADLTMGSGTTGVACIQTERDFIGFEIEEKYYELAQKRMSNIQGVLI